MARFINENELNHELNKILSGAEEQLFLISPYIKLHDRYKSTLKDKKGNPSLAIIIVFGKNEDDKSRSMGLAELEFFKEFPNIEIRYEKRLHAKYYANENFAIQTSMNLYSYSQDNNIETGVLTKTSFTGNLFNENNLDNDAWVYFNKVIIQAELLFKKEPRYESAMLGLTKKYTHSNIVTDRLSEFFGSSIKEDSTTVITEARFDSNLIGYCIRTGKKISFNPEQPMTSDAFGNWSKFGNRNYPEKYCHYSGEPSNGETSFAKPILSKNWKKASSLLKR
jgi:hypothetical protein